MFVLLLYRFWFVLLPIRKHLGNFSFLKVSQISAGETVNFLGQFMIPNSDYNSFLLWGRSISVSVHSFIGSGCNPPLDKFPQGMLSCYTWNNIYFCLVLSFLNGISALCFHGSVMIFVNGIIPYNKNVMCHTKKHLAGSWRFHWSFTGTYHLLGPQQMVFWWICTSLIDV